MKPATAWLIAVLVLLGYIAAAVSIIAVAAMQNWQV